MRESLPWGSKIGKWKVLIHHKEIHALYEVWLQTNHGFKTDIRPIQHHGIKEASNVKLTYTVYSHF